ncbi:MAG TPA: trehalose-6-phosphate synthase [Candidatus Wunengus sp. YC60]|uniref:trehalose-6-phosphate synthase n=1 Tax=Candidatus Wunengus sp. YC60 TaxID=3367697 RepID=UPI004025088A
MYSESIIIGYPNNIPAAKIRTKINRITENYNVIFINFHNSIIGIGGVGTVTRSTQKLIPQLHMVCYDPLITQISSFDEATVYPVLLDNKMLINFQLRYAKQYLWPILHGLAPHISRADIKIARTSYIAASQAFAEKVNKISTNNAKPWIYWINDYTMAGTVGLVRAIKPKAKICFSLRSPFGQYDLPKLENKDAILLITSIIQADFISFQRTKDLINFLLLAEKVSKHVKDIQVDWKSHTIQYRDHVATPRVIPLGNDPAYRKNLGMSIKAQRIKSRFINLANGKKIITSISRFETHKGIKEELDAIEQLLKLFPNTKEKFVFIRVAYLAKEYLAIPAYAKLYYFVKKRIRQINRTYGTSNWKPIIALLDKKFTDYEVTGLLRAANILLVMSLADGFNHSTVEGALSKQTDDPSLLLLSSDVGSSDYLGDAPIKMHPQDRVDSAIKLYSALQYKERDIRRREKQLKIAAARLSSNNWTLSLLEATVNIKNVPEWKES